MFWQENKNDDFFRVFFQWMFFHTKSCRILRILTDFDNNVSKSTRCSEFEIFNTKIPDILVILKKRILSQFLSLYRWGCTIIGWSSSTYDGWRLEKYLWSFLLGQTQQTYLLPNIGVYNRNSRRNNWWGRWNIYW